MSVQRLLTSLFLVSLTLAEPMWSNSQEARKARSNLPAGRAEGKPTASAARKTSQFQTPAASFDQLKAQAEKAREADQNAQAIQLYRELVKLRPSWTEGWWYLGVLHYDSNQYPEAVRIFRRVLSKEPKNALAYAMLGLCEYRLKQYASSLQHLAKARTMGIGGNEELGRVVRYHQSVLLTLGRQFEAALDLLGGFAVEHRESDAVLDALGMAVLRISEPIESLNSERREMIRQFGKAAFLFSERKAPESRALFDRLEARYRGQPNVAYAYGVSWLNAKDREKAMGFFRQELDRDPKHVASLMQLALHLIDGGKYDEALGYALRAEEAEPKNFAAYYALGRIYLELNDITRAVATLEKAVAIEPNVSSLHFVLSRAYGRAKRPADAARARAEFTRLEELQKEKRKATAFIGAQELSDQTTVPNSPPQ